MKRYLVIIIQLIIAHQGVSCTCKKSGPINLKDYHSFNKICIGKVVKIDKTKDFLVLITFKLIRNYSGERTSEFITIDSGDDGSCGFRVKNNEIWLMTLNKWNGHYTTRACWKNRISGSSYFKNDSTQLEKIITFKNGKVRQFLLPSKRLLAEGMVNDGLPIGEWKYYDDYENLKVKGGYVNGKKEGFWIEFGFYGDMGSREELIYKSGILKKQTSYNENIKSTVYEFREDGTVLFKKYNEAGKVIERDTWKIDD